MKEGDTSVSYTHLDVYKRQQYEELEKKMLLEVDETTIDVTSAAALSNKLLQLCNGAIYDGDRNVIDIHEDKLEAFREILDAYQGRHILVFYNFQHDRERILQLLGTVSYTHLDVYKRQSPSSAAKWINCPPSARLEEQLGEEESEAAREGTLAHRCV